MFSKKKNSVGGGDDESGLLAGMKMKAVEKAAPNHSLCPSLTLQQRITGFAICFCLGFVCSLLSAGMVFRILTGRVVQFAVLYTLGIVISLSSSMFLWGPKRQCKSMFDKKRFWTTVIFLTCMLLTITVVVLIMFKINIPAAIVLILVIIQYCAYFWYSLSFIPFGRTIFCKCFKKGVDEA